jgi:hypothetical protein
MEGPTTPKQPDAGVVGHPDATEQLRMLAHSLEPRLVREAGRDTWFVRNTTGAALPTVPVACDPDASIRRLVVNGEPTNGERSGDILVVALPAPLRTGQGTTIVVHYR